MRSLAGNLGRRIALHSWIAAVGLTAIASLQAWRASDQAPGQLVTERVIAHTVTGALVAPVLADGEITNRYPDLMSRVGSDDHEVPLPAILAMLLLVGVTLSIVPGLLGGVLEAVTAPSPGWPTTLLRWAVVSSWLVPLALLTSQASFRLEAAGAALGSSALLTAMTWPPHLAASTARWAVVVLLVWWAVPVADRVASAQPFAPIQGDVGGVSRLISSDGPPEAHRPTGDWSGSSGSEMSVPEHVVVIAVDTIGANHASTNGYPRPTLPSIRRMAEEEGVIFERHYAASPWTLPSTTSLFTSLHPHQHGVEDDGRRLSDDVVTLSGAFASQDWHTAALVTHLYVSAKFGLDSGFHEFWELSIDFNFGAGHQLVAEQLNDRVVPWMRSHQDERFLLYVHYFDPHWDYEPPPPYDTVFTDPEYSGPADGTWKFMSPFMPTARLMNEDDLARCAALYDGEIAYTDEHIGLLFEEMKRLGIWDDALVIVTADHGEEFQEHGSVGHTRTVYDEVVWIPLIIKPAGGRPPGWRDRVTEQTRTIDVAPTLLDAAGLRTPPSFAGTSLVPLMREGGEHRDTFSRTVRQRSKVAVAHDRWKLIRDLRSQAEELYDLRSDPGEQNDLIEEHPELADDLRRRMDAVLDDPGGSGTGQTFVEDVELSEEEREALEALGYVD